ncbi:Myoferlin [Chelonia mydas]|uniref:Myoferlin n=1 Tax=Chelonia mydas TaxID=8469 RepID=M7BWA8_CHEMY|nr:Myoferlin [Chelonia mydas]
MLRVIVESATNIPKTKFGKPDPIVSVIFKDEKKKTKKIDSELNPVWNEILEFDLKGIALDISSSLTIIVKDFETIGQNKLIGNASVALKELVGNQSRSLPFKLISLLNERGENIGATIDLVVGYEPPAGPANPNDPGGTNAQGTEDGEEDGGYEDGADGTVDGIAPAVPSDTKEAQLARRISKGKKMRRILSNKPQDFQIRVRVIEGRQLSGNNIKPVVKVHICGQTHRTRIKRGNNPYFDEMFFYNVHMTPLELLDETISIRVYDSYSLRADSLMGEFKIDIGYVYDEPVDDAFAQTVKELFGGDADKKNLVDPFVEVCFAGKKVCTNIVEKNANPEWNQVVHLQIKFPSMCEKIRLTVFDWDRLTKNDAVGTTYLSLSKIAASGGEVEVNTGETEVGFLPTFGPCYVNLYGSPREYTGFPDPYDELNSGKEEGVAYRGRILVELSTILDSKSVNKKIEAISSDDALVVEKYQRRRKFSLSAVFHSATMLQDIGEAIQFEVSIGNYGNKFDTTCKPLASTTQYSRAVFDGNYYYYLPWVNTKPVVTLTSFWEDISHRLDPVNLILTMVERLQSNIAALKSGIQAKVSENQLAEIWLKLIDELVEDTSKPLPLLEGKSNVTVLDTQIQKLRLKSLKHILEAATRMRNDATDVKATLAEIEDWLDKLMQLTEEPQNSIPDVIIWMIRGEKRLAYARIPAHQVLYSTASTEASGKYCGKTQTIFLKYPQDKNKGAKIPVQLRVNIWLGLTAAEKKFNSFAEGTFSVSAEMYENQALMFGKWGTSGLVGRHKFSDVTGKIKLKREFFLPPKGWEWEGEWMVDPERSLLTEADAGHSEFTDEVYQNESRYPGGEWKAAEEPYTDVNGEKTAPPGEITCPPGWIWEDDAWIYDINRAVDEKGWEYGITIPPDNKPKSWVAAEKMYHIHRRRRLVRKRKKDPSQVTTGVKAMASHEDKEGWEYASLIGWKFHWKQRSSDTFRRRRWRRKMSPSETHGAAAIFKLEGALGADTSLDDGEGKSSEKDKESATRVFGANTPIVSCSFDRVYSYHLRCYIYQARNLIALDKDSFSDPYAHVSFLHQSKTTEIIHSTLNPTWDQTLIFNEIEIYGDPQTVAKNPPNVVIELFDNDQVGKDEFLGRSVCSPMVKLNPEVDITPKLLWYPVMNGGKACGDILFDAELILRDKLLPKEELYTPSLVIKVIDHRQFGRKPVVGQCTIDSLEDFRCDPYATKEDIAPQLKVSLLSAVPRRDVVIEMEDTKPLLAAQEEETVDWWSKFYASTGEHEKCGQYIQKGYDTLKVYDCELENVPEFKHLTDFCDTFKLYRGKSEDNDDPSVVGEFKGSFRIYPLSDDPAVPVPPRQFRELPESGSQECIVRIYIVRALALQPQDNNGLCDSYIKITLSKKVIEDRDHYVPNTLNPDFGRMYELSCFLPQEKDLKISVYDYDVLTRDEKVGETIIDLENRFLSRFGAHCGIPQQYCMYIMRVIIWNTKDVILDEKSITGEEMSDIYVKGWMPGNEENKQKTDVHYRSLDGEGNFNWRFIFPFEYLSAEQLCKVSKKEHFWSLDKTEFRIPPKVIIQIWDNDKFSLDDYLGFVELDLHNTVIPAKVPEKCSIDMIPEYKANNPLKAPKTVSLFEQKSMKGWWPCYKEKDGSRVLAGKVEMTLEVLNEKEADERPAGKGRDEPNMNPKLDLPNSVAPTHAYHNMWHTQARTSTLQSNSPLARAP